MVTLGIEPTEPSTGYGYVVADGPPSAYAGRPTFRVERFEEKPTPQRAAELIAGGAAYWNAGIFVWRRDVLRSGLARHAPDILEPIRKRLAAEGGDVAGSGAPGWPGADLAEAYATLRATSIDYALLEPASSRTVRSRWCRHRSAGATWAPGRRCATTAAATAARS